MHRFLKNFSAKNALHIRPLGEAQGTCECCGDNWHNVWGMVAQGNKVVAAYWVKWTPRHLQRDGASLDLVLGPWGENADTSRRVLVSLWHMMNERGAPEVMVVNAAANTDMERDLGAKPLKRADVIGTPLAKQAFEIVDAIYEQDWRLFNEAIANTDGDRATITPCLEDL